MGRDSSKRSSASSTTSVSSSRSVWSNFSTGGLTDIREVDCEVAVKPVPRSSNGVAGFMLYTVGHNPARHLRQFVRTEIRTYTGMDSAGRIHQWREMESYFTSGGQKSKKHHTGGRRDGRTPPIRLPRPTQGHFPRPPPGTQPHPGPQQGIPVPPGVYPQAAAGFHQPRVEVLDEDYSSEDESSSWSGEDVIDVEPTTYAQPPPNNFPPRTGGPGRAFPGPPPPPPQGGLPGGAPFIRL